MKAIQKFKAIDGKEFLDKDECIKYEFLIHDVNTVMGAISPIPVSENCDFVNGVGFIQHDKEVLKRTRIDLLNLMSKSIDHKWIRQSINDETAHPSWVSRLVGDYGIMPFSDAWHRFSCMDKMSREWGQPYFANNPEKGKQVQIN